MTFLGFEIAAPPLGLGFLLGMNYALVAVGLVLVYRNSKLVNLAHGEIGAGAAVLLWVSTAAGLPYWVAFPVTLFMGGLLGAVLERSVVTRLGDAPRAIAALATLGAGQLILYVTTTLRGAIKGRPFPEPPGIDPLHIGTLIVQPGEVLALVLGPIAIGSLVFFMTKTSWGLALRGAAADMDLARLSGFAAGRLSAITWALGGVFATLTAILLFGLDPDSLPPTGFDLLLAALTAAVIARMTNLVVAAVAGMGLGLLQHLLLWNGVGGGSLSLAMFCMIFIVLALGRKRTLDVDKHTRWNPTLPSKRITLGAVTVPLIPIAVAFTGSLTLLAIRPTDATTMTIVFGFILLALSAAVMTGLSGELVLGQAAYAGLGAMASIAITLRTGNFFVGFSGAALAGAAAALVSSLPALRRRDLSLAVLSLAFAFTCVHWAFPQTWMFGSGADPGRPIVGSFAFTSAKSYAVFALLILCLGLFFADALWRSQLARRLVAQRDNPKAAATFGISTAMVRGQALLISGAIAGVAGAVLAHGTLSATASSFPIEEGVRAVGAAALGGLGSVSGSVWGSLFMVAIPSFMGGILRFIAASWMGWLLVIVAIPAGIAHSLARRQSRRSTEVDEDSITGADNRVEGVPAVFARPLEVSGEQRVLEVSDVSVTFADVTALNQVSIEIAAGEVVGLVGRNGAGKSTLLDVISGQRTPSAGQVWFDGARITHLGPVRRARVGMVRSFEGAILFPTLSVLETTLMALENSAGGHAIPRAVRRDEAMAVIRWIGLERIADKKIGELSTGLRRMAQLACLCARRPRLLLLDEPASGIAQAELDGLIAVLAAVNAELGTAILVVEHELRVVRRLASRVAVLHLGEIVAQGAPDDVLPKAGS